MTLLHFSVTPPARRRTRLPDWAGEFALLIAHLQSTGVLAELPERLRVQRQGGYCGLDIVLFLLAFFCWTGPRSLNKFGEACASSGDALAAVGGRSDWPTPSSVSRFLSAAGRADLDEFGTWLLGAGAGASALVGAPVAMARDTCGASWSVFDFDPSVQAQHLRALPEGPDLPPARRRSNGLCAPGYPGRKRGDTQFSTGFVISSGSGTWLQATVEPGNCDIARCTPLMAKAIVQAMTDAGNPLDHSLVRIDGAAGHASAVAPFVQAGVHYLVRLASCALLQQPDIAAFLASATWFAVPDSGSGPSRQACDLGSWLLQNHDWQGEFDLPPARLVVSRFPAKAKRGAGIFLDGWQYEVFATDINAAAWPAPETVELYYGRCGLENRFAQMFKDLGLDHAYSQTPAGQRLVTLVGLWTANLRTVMGAGVVGDLGEPVPQKPREVHEIPPAGPAPIVVPTVALAPEVTVSEVPMTREAATPMLAKLDWAKVLAKHPGWLWNGELKCPAGHVPRFHAVRPMEGALYAIFRVRRNICRECPLRSNCTKSTDPNYSKHIHANLGRVPRTIALRDSPGPQTAPRWLAPLSAPPGHLRPAVAPLVPSALRQAWCAVIQTARADVTRPPAPAKNRPPWLADNEIVRQRRRKTWRARVDRYALRERASLRIHAPTRANAVALARVVQGTGM